MVPLPTSPSSSSASSSSPRQLHSSSSGEWHAVVRRNVKSSLLLLLVLSTVFVFSVLHSSHGFGATTPDQQALTQTQTQTQTQSTDHGAVDRFVPGEEEGVPAENNEASEQSSDISLPSANTSAVPAPASSRAEQTGAAAHAEEKCDMSVGKWVREPRGPVYTNLTCPTLPDFKNCHKYGKDPGHLFWRWQPDGCDLPRFEPERFLDVARGKRMAFIGDSLARNQMDSLLCLLSQVRRSVRNGLLPLPRTQRHEAVVHAMRAGRGAHGRVPRRLRQVPDVALPGARLHAHGDVDGVLRARRAGARRRRQAHRLLRHPPRQAQRQLDQPPAGAGLRGHLRRQLVLPRQLPVGGRPPDRLRQLPQARPRGPGHRLRRPPRRPRGARGRRPVPGLQGQPRHLRAHLHARPLRARFLVQWRLLQQDAAAGGRRPRSEEHRVGAEEGAEPRGGEGEGDQRQHQV
uniref:Trichome birefringence-like N-terminal domain-containing protein n=1 Tax=Zea mays TaxID=4577 RepID=A0A804UB16_MAIZE